MACLSLSIVPFVRSSFFSCNGDHRDLHSFPTRRSSDLKVLIDERPGRVVVCWDAPGRVFRHETYPDYKAGRSRSEEHTSELQSLRHLVCRLLLEKKKNNSIRARCEIRTARSC